MYMCMFMTHNTNWYVYVHCQELRRCSAILLDAFFNLYSFHCLFLVYVLFFLAFTLAYFLVLNHYSFATFVSYFNKEIVHSLLHLESIKSIKKRIEMRFKSRLGVN